MCIFLKYKIYPILGKINKITKTLVKIILISESGYKPIAKIRNEKYISKERHF